ncbi:kinase domain-containing protein [Hypoxylon argillaceum]|nr:kinase domain-containing protein [Hypoxylon argillaceum]
MPTSTTNRLYTTPSTTNAEDAELYKVGGLHPVHIGDYLKENRYRIVHKLGFGSFSTVWLARDTAEQCFVSLKIYRADFQPESNELKILHHLAQQTCKHEGSTYVAKLKDDFVLSGPNGSHKCLVTQVAGNRLACPLGVNYSCLGPSRLLMSQLFLALDYLNSCNVGHGDMYTGNILFQLDNFDSWSDEEVYKCMGHPEREPVVRRDGEPVEQCAPSYIVRSGDLTRLEKRLLLFRLLLVDFGGAYFLDNPPPKTTTPSQYSAPEVLRALGVSPASDVWALGCATFEICAGYTLFKALFNPPIWLAWEERSNYFDGDGNSIKKSEHSMLVKHYSLHDRIRDMAFLYPADGRKVDLSLRDQSGLGTVEQVYMYDFLKRVFVFEPAQRISVKDALAHPFLALTTLS